MNGDDGMACSTMKSVASDQASYTATQRTHNGVTWLSPGCNIAPLARMRRFSGRVDVHYNFEVIQLL